MTENVARERESHSPAAAWLMRGRTESGRLTAAEPVVLELPPPAAAPAPAAETASPAQRDWSSALDLIHEAAAAIRISEERASELEQELDRAVAHALERQQFLEAQIAAADARAHAAETRAREAEEWLARLHDAVVAGFSRRDVQSPASTGESAY